MVDLVGHLCLLVPSASMCGAPRNAYTRVLGCRSLVEGRVDNLVDCSLLSALRLVVEPLREAGNLFGEHGPRNLEVF